MAAGLLIVVVATFLFLFIRALYCQYWFSSFVLSKEIAPLDVFNVFFSGGIAIWLGWYITKKLSEQRFLKEFVIKDIYRIEEQIEAFEKMSRSNTLELQTVFNELHELRNKIDRFERTARLTHYPIKEINNLKKYHTELYKVTTTENLFDPRNCRNEINTICGGFVLSLRKIVCEVNNY